MDFFGCRLVLFVGASSCPLTGLFHHTFTPARNSTAQPRWHRQLWHQPLATILPPPRRRRRSPAQAQVNRGLSKSLSSGSRPGKARNLSPQQKLLVRAPTPRLFYRE